jgi:glycosyltransferase involved in cell wall biosynthesis
MVEKGLKILQVAPYFYPAWAYGGVPRVAYELSKELVKRGHEVTVYTTDVWDRDSRYVPEKRSVIVDGVKVFYFRNLSNRLAYDYQLYFPIGLKSFVRGTIKDFDIIHLHGHRNFLNNIVHHYALKFKKPYIFSAHGLVMRIVKRILAKAIFDKFFGTKILNDAAQFIAASEREVKEYEAMGVEKEKVAVINNGIDTDAYEALPKKNYFREKYKLMGKKTILYLGQITAGKGIDFLVKAFSELNRDDCVLVIAGNDMGYKKRVLEIVKERSLGDRVIFTGLVVGEEKLAAYRDADILVYPSLHEIFGLVPFEAIMCGTPVVVTDDCGCGEIIGREDIGYTVKYNDVQGLRDKIEEVLSNGTAPMEKVKRGKEFIRTNLAWEKIGAEYENIYKKYRVKVWGCLQPR